jgi:hypothetical protein
MPSKDDQPMTIEEQIQRHRDRQLMRVRRDFGEAAPRVWDLLELLMRDEDSAQVVHQLEATFLDEFIDAEPRHALLLLGRTWYAAWDYETRASITARKWIEERSRRLILKHHEDFPTVTTLVRDHANTGFYRAELEAWFTAARPKKHG